MEIKKDYVPVKNRNSIYKGKNTNTTLTVHQTGNTAIGANAEMHSRLQKGGYGRASWHVQSDDKQIIQSYPNSAQCWHAGDGQGLGNKHSFSWELCINRDAVYLKTLQVGAEGIAKKLKELNLTPKELRQHHDWSRKNCPAQIRAGKQGVNWTKFKQMVQTAYDGGAVSKPSSPIKNGLTFDQVVNKTIAGEYGAQPQRENNINTKTNFSYVEVQAGVNRKLGGASATKISFDQVVTNTIDGQYGNGDARIKKIKSLGHSPSKVQAEVNKRLLGYSKTSKKSNGIIAQEVIDGKWGNNPRRSQKLKKAGYSPNVIQVLVNNKLK